MIAATVLETAAAESGFFTAPDDDDDDGGGGDGGGGGGDAPPLGFTFSSLLTPSCAKRASICRMLMAISIYMVRREDYG